MPTQTFLNLSKEKQNNIIDSAIIEFSEREYNQASINKIISRVGIPRGSFYMYFIDKHDIYKYILTKYIKKFECKMLSLISDNDGDFIKACEMMYDNIIVFCNNDKNKKLIINFLKELRLSNVGNFFTNEGKSNFEFFKVQILKNINKKKYIFNDDNLLFDAYIFSITTMIGAVTHYLLENSGNEKNFYLNRLHIIKYGILRRTNENFI